MKMVQIIDDLQSLAEDLSDQDCYSQSNFIVALVKELDKTDDIEEILQFIIDYDWVEW